MAYFEVCPECQSDRVLGSPKWGSAECKQCGYASEPESAPGFVPPAAPDLAQRCHTLAQSPAWLDAVLQHWPTPIAHEYQRLRQLLGAAQPDVTGAIWQLKDVAEVLLKFPTLVLFRDLCCNEPAQVSAAIKRQLLAKPLSMGDWHAIGLNLSQRVLESKNPLLLSASVAGLFRNARGKPTALMGLLQRMVKWRNDEIGHGAFRIDARELVQSLEGWVSELNAALAAHVSVWDALSLVRSDAAPTDPARLLMGSTALGAHRHGQASATRLESLRLQAADGRSLLLSPYVALRLCSECTHHDVFFFDSYKGHDRRAFYLDYYRGHKISLAGHMDRDLHQDVALLQSAPAGAGGPDGLAATQAGYMRSSVFDLLQAQQLKASVLSPDYLHQPLEAFMAEHDQGIFWLKAQGHVGKTLFTQDVLQRRAKRHALCCAFHIKREYNANAVQFAAALGAALCRSDVLDITGRSMSLPELASDIAPDQAPAAFVEWIESLRQLSGMGEQPLLVCIDGLDELPEAADRLSIADYLPEAGQLPEGLYLLLTSRPAAQCPAWLNSRLQGRLVEGPDMQVMEVEPASDIGYHALMRSYFYQHLEVQWKHDLQERLAHGAGAGAPVQAAPGMPEAMQKFAAKQLMPAGQSVDWALVNAVFADFESCFKSLLEKADFRFLFFSYLVDTLASLADWKVVEGLPAGKLMFNHFIAQLELQLSDKLHALALRVLLVLAAAEEVDAHQRSWQWVSPPWTGLPLGLLAALLNDSESAADGSAISDRLVFVLYTLKTVLASYKADASPDAHFALGLKGLGAALRELKAQELDQVHTQLAGQFLNEWSGKLGELPEEDVAAQYGLATVMGHADLGKDAALIARLAGDLSVANEGWLVKAQQALARHDDAQALPWLDCLIEMQRRILLSGNAEMDMDLLALTYFRNRREQASLYVRQGSASTALKALESLQHDLRRDLGENKAHADATFLELLRVQEQMGWIQLETLQDTDAAAQCFLSCIQHIVGNARPEMPEALRLDLTVIMLRVKLKLAKCNRQQGRMDEWKLHLDSIAQYCGQLQQSGRKPTEVAMLQTQLALELCHVAQEEADGQRLESLQAVLASMREVPEAEQHGDYQMAVAALLMNIAHAYRTGGHALAAGKACASEAVQLLRSICASDVFLQQQLAQALALLGSVQEPLGESAQAEAAFNEAKSIYSQMLVQLSGMDMTPRVAQSIAVAQHNLGALEHRVAGKQASDLAQDALARAEACDMQDNPEEALEAWQAVKAGLDRLMANQGDGRANGAAELQCQSAVCAMKIGMAQAYAGQVDSAKQALGEAVSMFVALQSWPPANGRQVPANLATCLQWQAYLEENEEHYDGAVEKYLHSLDVLGAAIEVGQLADLDVFAYGLQKALVWALRLQSAPQLRATLLHLQQIATGARLGSAFEQHRAAELVSGIAEVLADLPAELRLDLQQQPGGLAPAFLSSLGW